MRVALRVGAFVRIGDLGELTRVFDDYGIETVAVLGVGLSAPEGVDRVIAVGEGARADEIVLSEATAEAAAEAAVALAGEKYFADFATYGIACEEIERRAKGLGKRGIAVFVRPLRSGALVRVRYGERTAKVDVDAVCDAVRAEFADCLYAEKNCEIEQFLIERLRETERRIAVAESFTGGMVASRLTSVAGASGVFSEGVVAYTEAAKIDRLGVEAQTVAFHSAVSVQTAFQMAAGLLRTGRAEVVAATTGYAGPTGKDVGKCFIAVGDAKRINVFEYRFAGTRAEITAAGVRAALNRLADFLLVKVK